MDNARRSGTRVSCEIPASLRVHTGATAGCEECTVILVNLQGCAVRFNRPLEVGETVCLEGLPYGSAEARVVNCISVEKGTNLWLLGLALDEPRNIWGIDTPPADWYLEVPKPSQEMSFSARASGY